MASYPQLWRGLGMVIETDGYPEFSGGSREIGYPEFSPSDGEGRDEGKGQMCSWGAYGEWVITKISPWRIFWSAWN